MATPVFPRLFSAITIACFFSLASLADARYLSDQPTGLHDRKGVWCVAASGANWDSLNNVTMQLCTIAVDCSSIQVGGSCFNPFTVAAHASVVFNLYFQKHSSELKKACDFGGLSILAQTDPSHGTCIFPLA